MYSMSLQDFSFIVRWWSLFFVIGLFFFPFVSSIFSPLVDKGYAFAKIIGLLIISYAIFLLGMGLVPFTQIGATGIAIIVCVGFLFLPTIRKKNVVINFAAYRVIQS